MHSRDHSESTPANRADNGGTVRAALDGGADYATRREPSHLREPIAHHVNIREAAPEALSMLSLPILAHPMPTGVPSPGQRDKS
jgi:hypothetical protein